MARKEFTGFDPELQDKQQKWIAQGALTNSKRPECFVKGVYPTHIKEAHGAYCWDTRNNRYVDYICANGTSLLGYSNTEINTAISTALRNGVLYSLPSALESEASERLSEIVPFIEKVRFLKTGSDACIAAVKIARAKTGRGLVLSSGYHGWGDDFISLTPPAIGVTPRSTISQFSFIDQITDQVASVIVEPIVTDLSNDRIQWLQQLRKKCDDTGALLIFDEVITGFRFPKYSVSQHLGITPDLICLGKAIANGMPLSVVAGKRDVMECGEYFVSSTYAGEVLSLAAHIKVIDLLQKKYDINYLWDKGGQFLSQFNALYPEKLKIDGYPTRGVFTGDPLTKALFWQESVKAGLLFGASWFFNFAHIELTDQVIGTCRDILNRIKTGSVKLTGEMPVSPFAQRVRENANGY